MSYFALYIFSIIFIVGGERTYLEKAIDAFSYSNSLQLQRTSRSLALGLVEACTLGGPSRHHLLVQNLMISKGCQGTWVTQ